MISKWLGVNLNHQTPYFGVWRRANVLLVSPWRRGRVMSAGEGRRLPARKVTGAIGALLAAAGCSATCA
jgi:hypothetical protein